MTGLDNGTAYTFRLRAVNEAGAGAASEEKSAVPTAPPDRPTGLVITPGDALLHLAWDDPGDATITGWQMRAATRASDLSGTVWRNVAGSDAETTRATIAGLVNGTGYHVELRAVNPAAPARRPRCGTRRTCAWRWRRCRCRPSPPGSPPPRRGLSSCLPGTTPRMLPSRVGRCSTRTISAKPSRPGRTCC